MFREFGHYYNHNRHPKTFFDIVLVHFFDIFLSHQFGQMLTYAYMSNKVYNYSGLICPLSLKVKKLFKAKDIKK